MIRFIVWMFWCFYYVCLPPSRDFKKYLLLCERTHPPWRKFQPNVYRNDDGNRWQIYLSDEPWYSEKRSIEVYCFIGIDSGDIIGFDIYDEILKGREKGANDGTR